MLDDTPHNINSIENNNNPDVIDSFLDSEIESVISEIESLELSLANSRKRLRTLLTTKTIRRSQSFRSSRQDQDHPITRFGYFVGDIVRITNSVKIGPVRIPYKQKSGSVHHFTDHFIFVKINFKNAEGVFDSTLVSRIPKNVNLVRRYNE